MKPRTVGTGLAIFLIASVLLAPGTVPAQNVPRMSIDQLKDRLEDGNTVVIDVRRQGDFQAGEPKIKGAVREDWKKPSRWAAKYDPKQTVVLYCA